MKKLITIAVMMLAATAFADSGALQGQNTVVKTASESTASNAGNSQAITFQAADVAGAATETAKGELAVANTNAQLAKDLAAINGNTARDVASTTQVIKNTPSVSGPALTTSNDTCMGSTSGSVNIAGLGIGGGSSWVDTNCKMLKNSRELWNMGMKAAAMALMCNDAANKEALELTGYVCPQSTKAKESAAKAETNTQYSGNDPIVRARLGLAPLNTVASN